MEIDRINNLMKRYGVTPSKSKGQNFLIDETVVDKIIKIAGVDKNTNVLEIGPGFGVLTRQLYANAKKVVVVELDKNVIQYIRDDFKDIEIVEGDILSIRNCYLANKLENNYKLIANIPYNITSRIIRQFTEGECKPQSLTLMVQKEVAQRIIAKAGQMSKLSVSVQFYALATYELDVTKMNFEPIPAVDSVVIKIVNHDKYLKLLKVSEKDFFRIVKFGFSAKRKKLSNNLAAGLNISQSDVVLLLNKIGLDFNVRSQTLTIQNWIDLTNLIYQ